MGEWAYLSSFKVQLIKHSGKLGGTMELPSGLSGSFKNWPLGWDGAQAGQEKLGPTSTKALGVLCLCKAAMKGSDLLTSPDSCIRRWQWQVLQVFVTLQMQEFWERMAQNQEVLSLGSILGRWEFGNSIKEQKLLLGRSFGVLKCRGQQQNYFHKAQMKR